MYPLIYLDNSATSRFKPKKAARLLKYYYARSANAGRASHKEAVKTALAIENARQILSDAVGGKNVVFTKNCTEALNLAIFGLNPKGEVLVSPMSHNSVLRPLKQLELAGKITMKILPSSIHEPVDYGAFITPKTALVAVPHISNVTGAVEDISTLIKEAKRLGILTLVDCAQSAGYLDLRNVDADLIAAAGHKGLHGPQGTGFLAYRNGIRLSPVLYGGTGTTTMSLVQSSEAPETYEAGTQNAAGIIALGAAAEWSLKRRAVNSARLVRLAEYTHNELKKIKNVTVYSPSYSPAGIVSFNIGGLNSADAAFMLDKDFGIEVRGGLHCAPLAHRALGTASIGAIRVSYGCDNTAADAARLIFAVKKIARNILSK